MHDRANLRPRLCIRIYVRWMCIDASALWRTEAAWALAIRCCKDLAWALTRKWALSIHAAKTSTCARAYPGVGACPGHYGMIIGMMHSAARAPHTF